MSTDSRQRVWFGRRPAAAARDEDAVQLSDANGAARNDDLVGMYEDRSGASWFPAKEGGVWRHARGVWTRFGREDGFVAAPIRAIYETRDGAVWFLTTATARFGTGRDASSG